MTILIYYCPQAPANRQYIAQFEKIKNNLYLTIHGPTSEIAKAKAELMLQYSRLAIQDRKAFDLRGRLALLGESISEEEEELL